MALKKMLVSQKHTVWFSKLIQIDHIWITSLENRRTLIPSWESHCLYEFFICHERIQQSSCWVGDFEARGGITFVYLCGDFCFRELRTLHILHCKTYQNLPAKTPSPTLALPRGSHSGKSNKSLHQKLLRHKKSQDTLTFYSVQCSGKIGWTMFIDCTKVHERPWSHQNKGVDIAVRLGRNILTSKSTKINYLYCVEVYPQSSLQQNDPMARSSWGSHQFRRPSCYCGILAEENSLVCWSTKSSLKKRGCWTQKNFI